jgi:hypothetical protein
LKPAASLPWILKLEPLTMNPKMGLYYHRDLIGSPSAFTKVSI